ncbi:hypothetical protein AVEN_89921-1 [Araneus ventricosus]|uniref:Uncharacterized protein n=1 Tax=Araneus ventricosus TaxID=182803 RepID=A0A4Y2W4E1_ARAVE|nr:hypothetical protein AVEN_89921-1 [Araneus ventricosus]
MIYDRANIPTASRSLDDSRILQKYQCIIRNYKRDMEKANFKKKANDLVEEAKNSLFDIASCKCTDFTTCSCEKPNKFPVKERMFLQDQISLRIGFVSCVDVPISCSFQNTGSFNRLLSSELSRCAPWPTCHARWLTIANRILRL